MKKKKQSFMNDEELNTWQPASDMFSALLLILMLIILLLGLYLVHIPEHTEKDPDAGNTYADSNDSGQKTPEPTAFIWIPNAGGGEFFSLTATAEASASPSASVTPTMTPTVTPGTPGSGSGGPGNNTGKEEEGIKSAVYVMLVDGDTNRVVKEENVQFELYDEKHSLQVLNTYYPVRMSYRTYETTEAGTFYLPEKLFSGEYELQALTAAEGYDPAPNVQFEIHELYDWADPLVVRVPVYPARNIVRVRMTDAETGRPVSGGTFDVVAIDDIITSDGTLRYRAGEVVSAIVCDDNGEGVSGEIYLGEYALRQKDIPQYYAGMAEDVSVTVENRTGSQPPTQMIACERTRIRLSLKDELYPTHAISGAVFSVVPEGSGQDPFEVTTDAAGAVVLDTLDKGVNYRITQMSSGKNYRLDATPYNAMVSGTGRIGGEPEATLELWNHMIRVSIGITDEFSDVEIPNVSLTLYDMSGAMVRSWTTTGTPMTFNDLEPGSYYVIKDGDSTTRLEIQVQDVADLQSINLKSSYLMQYIIIGAVAAVVLIVAIAVILLIRKRKKRSKQAE